MRKKLIFLALMIMVAFPTVANANLVWPSIYIAKGMRSFDVILWGLLIETAFVKVFQKETWLRSAIISVLMNLASTLLGIILIPAIGFFGALLLGLLSEVFPALGNTFDTPLWIFSYFLTVLLNAVIEGFTTKFTARTPFKKMFWWLVLANTVSVAVCVAVHGFTLNSLMM